MPKDGIEAGKLTAHYREGLRLHSSQKERMKALSTVAVSLIEALAEFAAARGLQVEVSDWSTVREVSGVSTLVDVKFHIFVNGQKSLVIKASRTSDEIVTELFNLRVRGQLMAIVSNPEAQAELKWLKGQKNEKDWQVVERQEEIKEDAAVVFERILS